MFNPEILGEDFYRLTGERLDAGETAMLAKQLEYVYARTYDIKYAELKARRFVPVNTSVDSGAESYSYKQYSMFGAAKLIANYADDLPRVDVLAREFLSPIKSIGAAYGFTIMDLRRAAKGQAQLDMARARAARRAHEQTFDDLVANGDADAGLTGFANNANVPIATPVTGQWTTNTATSLQMVEDLNTLTEEVVTGTLEAFEPDTLLMAPEVYTMINNKPMSSTGDTNMTVLKYFLENNTYINSVERWNKLSTAGAGSTTRCIAYKRDPEVLEAIEPQPFEQLPQQWKNLEALIPTHSRCGGVKITYPLAIAYMDDLDG